MVYLLSIGKKNMVKNANLLYLIFINKG